MEKDNRKYRICFIDYMWYVAEIWHEWMLGTVADETGKFWETQTAGCLLVGGWLWCGGGVWWGVWFLLGWVSADIAPFRLDDWFGHSDSSLLSSRFILQATLYSRTA